MKRSRSPFVLTGQNPTDKISNPPNVGAFTTADVLQLLVVP